MWMSVGLEAVVLSWVAHIAHFNVVYYTSLLYLPIYKIGLKIQTIVVVAAVKSLIV